MEGASFRLAVVGDTVTVSRYLRLASSQCSRGGVEVRYVARGAKAWLVNESKGFCLLYSYTG